MSGLLQGAVSYLAGPIDQAADDGIGWRIEIKKQLVERGIQMVCLDPTHKISDLVAEVGQEKERQREFVEAEDWEGLRRFMKPVVRSDLRCVDLGDLIIAMVDIKTHMCGTYHEIFTGNDEQKPVLLIVKGGKQCCPMWLFGIIHYDYMFDSIEDCVDYLVKVNDSEVILDDKWVLIRNGMRKLAQSIYEGEANASQA